MGLRTLIALSVTVAGCVAQRPASVGGAAIDPCAAAQVSVGSRVRIIGEFGGFAYDHDSKHISIHSAALCSRSGAGLAFVTLFDDAERGKLRNTRPRPKRGFGKGDIVEVEGTVITVEDGRFVHASDGIVR